MKMLKLAPALILVAGLAFTSCKPKDTDIQAATETAIKANPDATGVTVAVANGVATLSGEVKDQATKDAIEASAKGAKGVKSVVNNLTVTPPAAPVVVAQDDPLTAGVRDAVKDFAGVTFTVNNGTVEITGAAVKDRAEIMKRVNALKPGKVVFK